MASPTIIDFASGATQVSTATGTVSLTGLTVAPGDLLLAFNGSERGALADVRTPTCPDGALTEIGSGVSGSSGLFQRVYQRTITTQNTASMTVTVTNVAGATQKTIYAGALVLRGHAGVGNVVTAADANLATIAHPNVDDLVVVVATYEDPQTTAPTPASMTSQYVATDASSLGQQRLWTQALSSAADVDAKNIQGNSNSRVGHGLIVLAVAAAPDPSGFLSFF